MLQRGQTDLRALLSEITGQLCHHVAPAPCLNQGGRARGHGAELSGQCTRRGRGDGRTLQQHGQLPSLAHTRRRS